MSQMSQITSNAQNVLGLNSKENTGMYNNMNRKLVIN